jgi:hypothetical protein
VAAVVADKYGPWGIVAGGSDGVGAAFAHGMAARGINVVLVARRVPVLEAAADGIRARHGAEVRTVALDLSVPGAVAETATSPTPSTSRRRRSTTSATGPPGSAAATGRPAGRRSAG